MKKTERKNGEMPSVQVKVMLGVWFILKVFRNKKLWTLKRDK